MNENKYIFRKSTQHVFEEVNKTYKKNLLKNNLYEDEDDYNLY